MVNTSIQPEYFFDHMSWTELDSIIENSNNKQKEEWDRTRWAAYISAMSQGAKLKSPQDLVTFSWEESDIIKPEVPKEDLEAMKAKFIHDMKTKTFKPVKNIDEISKR
jgi:hypothetical protein